jgi:hypothetical protein
MTGLGCVDVADRKITSVSGYAGHPNKLLEYNGCAHFTIDNIAIVTQP